MKFRNLLESTARMVASSYTLCISYYRERKGKFVSCCYLGLSFVIKHKSCNLDVAHMKELSESYGFGAQLKISNV